MKVNRNTSAHSGSTVSPISKSAAERMKELRAKRAEARSRAKTFFSTEVEETRVGNVIYIRRFPRVVIEAMLEVEKESLEKEAARKAKLAARIPSMTDGMYLKDAP